MRRRRGGLTLTATVILSLLAGATATTGTGVAQAEAMPGSAADPQVLVYHGTEAPTEVTRAAVAAITEIGDAAPAGETFETEATDDPAAFSAENLERYNAVVFLSQEGGALDADQEAAFQGYIENGGGFLGLHDAADAQPDSEWFSGLLGARPAAGGPDEAQQAVVEVGDRNHPATKDLPLEWNHSDVWANWQENPSGSVHTVARVREQSYEPGEGALGWDHPVSWCRDYEGGRSFYTGMGGTAAGFEEANLRSHLRGALLWTTRLARADCQATISANYQAERVTQPNQEDQLDQIGEPHGLAVADDGRVLYIGRGGGMPTSPVVTDWDDPEVGLGEGTLHVWDPESGEVTKAGSLDVFGNKGGGEELVKNEEGLLGITLDPNFMENGWVYLQWTPHAGIDREKHLAERRLSRFTFDLESNTLDTSYEQELLSWQVQIHSCCHAGGGMDWDSKGNLYVATGDNNSSQFSDGYSGNNPEPSFEGTSFSDARRTAGNTNNLSGKILRIHPEEDGSYTVPEGNLFTGEEEGGGKTRAEIYVMGVRNPARIFVDKKTDWLYAGWVGPDAEEPSSTWGPAKYDTFAVMTEAGNQGWPYCMGNKQPYRDRNLPDPEQPLDWYDCDNLKNESPNNDGLVDLPSARDNNIWYSPQGGGPDFPRDENGVPSYNLDEQELKLPWLSGGGQAAMNGPVYRYDEESGSDVKWPEYWDGKWFVGDYSDSDPRNAVLLDPSNAADGGLPVHSESLQQIVPTGNDGVGNLMDWRFGPDGSLYVLDYGRGFFTADEKSALWRITYTGGAPTPAPADYIGPEGS